MKRGNHRMRRNVVGTGLGWETAGSSAELHEEMFIYDF